MRRPWLFLAMAGCSMVGVGLTQENAGTAGGTPAGGTTTGNAGATNTGATDAGTPGAKPEAPPATAPEPAPDGTGTTGQPSNPFGLPDLPAPREDSGSLLLPGSNGASTTFGSGILQRRNAEVPETTESAPAAGAPPAPPNAPTFTAPGLYGANSQIFDTGQGRFTRPRYRYGASFSVGFDDNVFQSPNGDTGVPEQTFTQVIPAQPEISTTVTEQEFVGLRSFNSKFIPVFQTVNRKVILRPATPEEEIVTVIPAVEPQQKTSSVVTGLDATFDAQWATSRSLFTFDLRAGVDYYWDRPGGATDYNGSMSMVYLRKFGRRFQFSATTNAAYSSEPNFADINVSTQNNQGSYFTGTSKFDAQYRWSARFSTDTSLGLSTINYVDEGRQTSNYWSATLGNAFRYLWSPRLTSVLEARYDLTRYYESDLGNSKTLFLLLGADWALSRRLRGTVRLGESIRTFDFTGETVSTPYIEASASYQPSRRSQYSASIRYGFENTSVPTQENIVFRTSLGYSYAFSPRLSTQASLFYIKNNVTSGSGTDLETTTTSSVLDGSISLNYLFSRRFSMSARYSYTFSDGDFITQQYDRSRFFLTSEYNF